MKALNDISVGQIFESARSGKFKVLEYNSSKDVKVEFLDTGFTNSVYAHQVRHGELSDWLLPTVYGIGYIGSAAREGGPLPERWRSLIQRCYDTNPNTANQRVGYEDVTICDEWLNFTNFKAWVEQQIGFDQKGWQLDKDLLIKGNKIYRPEACIYLPAKVNKLLLKSRKSRGDYPIGVSQTASGRFSANCHDTIKGNYLGAFDTPEEAFSVYKKRKEEVIKQVAEEYKDIIDSRAYKALINYEVEITD